MHPLVVKLRKTVTFNETLQLMSLGNFRTSHYLFGKLLNYPVDLCIYWENKLLIESVYFLEVSNYIPWMDRDADELSWSSFKSHQTVLFPN